MTITWIDGKSGPLSCPACHMTSEKEFRLSTKSAVPPSVDLPLAQCGQCGSAFFPDAETPAYEHGAGGASALAFYLEQGAGIDVMIDTLALIGTGQVRRYLEIGCGFGFSLDFARHAFGWTVAGIDPGSNARAGRDLLGLDISSGYLRSGADLGDKRPDLILCSEVIEHIAEPDGFVAILRDALAPGGALLLTTPNAGAITPETPPGVLVPLLSPGYHLVLFSRDGLESCLKRAGFARVVVEERGATLVAVAGDAGLQVDTSRRLDRELYRSWLASRIQTVGATHSLGLGLRYRLFKERVNSGDYANAALLADELAAACRERWSLNLDDPQSLLRDGPVPQSLEEYRAFYPFCLCGILYHRAVLAVQTERDRDDARATFLAAARFGEMLRAVLRNEGMDDGEAEDLSWRARASAAWLLAWSDPAAAAAAAAGFASDASPLLKELPKTALVRETVQTVLTTLVNLGHYPEAETLAGLIAFPASANSLDAKAEFAMGILDINHQPDPGAGAPGTRGGSPGLRYRLFRDRVNSADYANAAPLADELAALCRERWSLNLDNPQGLLRDGPVPQSLEEYRALYPFCLYGILYHRAILALQAGQQRDDARAAFLAAARFGEMLRAVLRNEGMDDGEAEDLSWRARASAAWLLAWTDPAAAAAAAAGFASETSPLLKELPKTAMVRETVQTVLVTLVNLGHYPEAETLAGLIALPADEAEAGSRDAEAEFALGVLDINHRSDPVAGADRFARVYRLSARQPDQAGSLPWLALYHEAVASLRACDGNRAQAALGQLLGPPPDPAFSPVPDGLREQALELVSTHQLTI